MFLVFIWSFWGHQQIVFLVLEICQPLKSPWPKEQMYLGDGEKASLLKLCFESLICFQNYRYRLNVYIPQIHTLKPNSQYNGIERRSFGRRLVHESGALLTGVSAPIKESPSPLQPREDTVRQCHLWKKAQTSPDTESAVLWPWTCGLQGCEKLVSIVYRPVYDISELCWENSTRSCSLDFLSCKMRWRTLAFPILEGMVKLKRMS